MGRGGVISNRVMTSLEVNRVTSGRRHKGSGREGESQFISWCFEASAKGGRERDKLKRSHRVCTNCRETATEQR